MSNAQFKSSAAKYVYASMLVNALYWKRRAMDNLFTPRYLVYYNRMVWYNDQTLPYIMHMTGGEISRMRQEIDAYMRTHDAIETINYFECKPVNWQSPITCTDQVNADIIAKHWQGII